MDSYADFFNCYVEQNPPASGDAKAVVDQMYWSYIEQNRIDNDKTGKCYASLRERIKVPMREFDEILYTISDLCLEYGRLAFAEGLKIGMLLMQSISTP